MMQTPLEKRAETLLDLMSGRDSCICIERKNRQYCVCLKLINIALRQTREEALKEKSFIVAGRVNDENIKLIDDTYEAGRLKGLEEAAKVADENEGLCDRSKTIAALIRALASGSEEGK